MRAVLRAVLGESKATAVSQSYSRIQASPLERHGAQEIDLGLNGSFPILMTQNHRLDLP